MPPRKSICKRGHPLKGPNCFIRPSGKRMCKKCHRLWSMKNGYFDHIRRKFHTTKTNLLVLLSTQNNRCCCGFVFNVNRKGLRPCLDHDHNCCRYGGSCGRCIRGLLCRRCNFVLGAYESRNDVHLLPEYLKHYLNQKRIA